MAELLPEEAELILQDGSLWEHGHFMDGHFGLIVLLGN